MSVLEPLPCTEELISEVALGAENIHILKPDSAEITEDIEADPSPIDSEMSNSSSLHSVRYVRRDSEQSVEKKEPKDNAYWTLNDDDHDDVDNASEADEESIASSIRGTRGYTFLKQADECSVDSNSMADTTLRHSTALTEDMVHDSNMSFKIIAKSQKIHLQAPSPTIAPPILPALAEAKNTWTVDNLTKLFREILYRYQKMPFLRYRLFTMSLLLLGYFVLPPLITGILCGLYLSLTVFLFVCVSDPLPPSTSTKYPAGIVMHKVKDLSAQEDSLAKVYKGWMNILNEPYNPLTFHVNHLQTVLVRLDGNMLRISRPNVALLRHARCEDPTLKKKEPKMISQSIYDLTNATVKLRPKRLARRRWWTRRYPICITLASVGSEIHSRNEDRFLSQSKTLENFTKDVSEEKTGLFSKMFGKKRSRTKSETASQSSGSLHNSEIVETSVVDNNSMAERATIGSLDMCKEADDYDTDAERSEEEGNMFGVQRSHSAEDLRQGSHTRLKRDFPGPKTRATRKVFLFARSTREKERWFHKLRKACSKYESHAEPRGRKMSLPSMGSTASDMSMEHFLYMFHHLQFSKHLDEILADNADYRSREEKGDANGTVYMDLGRQLWTKPSERSSNGFVLIVNLLATRFFYDFCRDAHWCEAVRNKIQTKLASIHLPYFIETLEVSSLDVGTAIPKITQVYAPTVDDWGTWVDLDIKYSGCIKLVLETKVNLMKLKGTTGCIDEEGEEITPAQLYTLRKSPTRYSDEDVPESPESSADEEFGKKMKFREQESSKTKTGKKILHFVDKIAHSKYFKEAAELKPIKKMMEEISSTRLILNVEVTSLEGTMAINFAPPPSDRLWYGFREPPQMSLKAIPQVGGRSVVFSTISDWIEAKLKLVLEKNLVVPNLDDIIVPILSGNELISGPLNM